MNKSMFKSRLVIGSANFSQSYGADKTLVNLKEKNKIINLAKANKIYNIDTAQSYLKKKNIFKNLNNKFNFFTKVIPDNQWISFEMCQKQIEDHFMSFGNHKVETLLFHDTKILFSKYGNKIFENLEILKKKKYFTKIGLSIYDVNCLNKLITNYNFDVVQCPYNILDTRILKSGWYEKLKVSGIEIHVRSIFLQGLLVNKSYHKNKYFKKWQKYFSEWFNYLNKNSVSPIDYCLSDLLNHDFDKIIVGVNNSKNLNEIVNFKNINKNKMVNLDINDKKLIDPRNWRLK